MDSVVSWSSSFLCSVYVYQFQNHHVGWDVCRLSIWKVPCVSFYVCKPWYTPYFLYAYGKSALYECKICLSKCITLNCVFLCLAYPKGKKYNGPLNTKKKKSFKEKDSEGKKPLQTKQRAQKRPILAANKNGPKAQSIRKSSTQASGGESNIHLLAEIQLFISCDIKIKYFSFFFFLKKEMKNLNSPQWIFYARGSMRRLKNPEGRFVVWSRVHIFLL